MPRGWGPVGWPLGWVKGRGGVGSGVGSGVLDGVGALGVTDDEGFGEAEAAGEDGDGAGADPGAAGATPGTVAPPGARKADGGRYCWAATGALGSSGEQERTASAKASARATLPGSRGWMPSMVNQSGCSSTMVVQLTGTTFGCLVPRAGQGVVGRRHPVSVGVRSDDVGPDDAPLRSGDLQDAPRFGLQGARIRVVGAAAHEDDRRHVARGGGPFERDPGLLRAPPDPGVPRHVPVGEEVGQPGVGAQAPRSLRAPGRPGPAPAAGRSRGARRSGRAARVRVSTSTRQRGRPVRRSALLRHGPSDRRPARTRPRRRPRWRGAPWSSGRVLPRGVHPPDRMPDSPRARGPCDYQPAHRLTDQPVRRPPTSVGGLFSSRHPFEEQ